MEHKKVIVTGGNRGIGKGIVLSLLDQGYLVLATSRDSKKFDMSHQNLEVANLDVCDQASIDDFQQIVNDFDPDILVNNAGIARDNLMLRMSEQDWAEVLNVHLTGQFKLMKNFLRGMLKNKWGRIINISSAAAAIGNKGQSNYVAAKAGIEAMSKTLAREVGSKNITVNCVAPGFIETDMLKDLDQEYLSVVKSEIPLQRLGKPEEIASLVKFLASDEANYITGQTVHINGGLFM